MKLVNNGQKNKQNRTLSFSWLKTAYTFYLRFMGTLKSFKNLTNLHQAEISGLSRFQWNKIRMQCPFSWKQITVSDNDTLFVSHIP